MTTAIPADAELVTRTYLVRSGSRVLDEVAAASSVVTVIPSPPADATFPLLRITRIGGAPVRQVPYHLDAAILQLDAFGGSKYEARRLAATALAELADMNKALHMDAVVTGVDIGQLRYIPDSTFTPARPRYTVDVIVYLHRDLS